jgi:hypothetical protein
MPKPLRVALAVFVLILGLGLVACASQTSLIGGRVMDVEGKPISNAQIVIGRHKLATDGEGAFSASLRPAEYEMVVSAPGFVVSSVSVVLTAESAPVTRDVTLQPRRLSGVVVENPGGEPISGALVTLGAQETISDAQGGFTLRAAQPAALQVSCRGCQTASLTADEVGEAFDDRGALVAPLQVAVELHMLSGQVIDAASSQPIAGALVRAGETQAETDSDGRYFLKGIEWGDVVQAQADGYRPPVGFAYDGQGELLWTLDRWQVELAVRDQVSDEPLAGVLVRSATTEGITDAAGQLVMALEPGQAVTLTLGGYCTETLTYQDETSLAVVLRPSRLIVRLTDSATQQPVPNARVQLFEAGSDVPRLARSDAAGQVDLSDVALVDRLFVKAPNYARVTVPITQMGVVDVALEPFESRGLFIPFGRLTQPDRILELLDMVDNSVLNSVVVDVKSDASYIAWPSENPLAVEAQAYVPQVMDIQQFLRWCQERDIYVIARMVIFKDDLLAAARPQWAIKRETGALYTDPNNKWMDPFRQEVHDYNIALAVEVANMGFDEVQFDYVRFPTDGGIRGLVYQQESTFESRVAAISGFLEETYEALAPTPAFFSADIYGLTVWVTDPNCDRKPLCDLGIGQWVEDMAPHVDYMSPMLYPDTFAPGSFGFAQPASHPYDIIYRSVVKALQRTNTAVRPWLSHYSPSWLGVTYGVPDYVAQRKAAEDAGSHGWLFWNARANYTTEVFAADAYSRVPNLPSPPAKQ